MENQHVSLVLETKDSRVIRSYEHDGKTFVQSVEDTDYQLRIKNKTNGRVKVVASVDGLNILNGEPVSDKPDEPGYLLNAFAEELFKGFRVDENTVAAFRFTKKEGGYAQSKGMGASSGVIALRVFSEKENIKSHLDDLRKKYEELLNRPREK